MKLPVLLTQVVLLQLYLPASIAAGTPENSPRPSERVLTLPDRIESKPPVDFNLPPVPESSRKDVPGITELQIDAIKFDGNSAISSEELQAVAASFVGGRLRPAEIEELRHRITRYYIGKGYVNSGALLHDGAYRDGTLTFRIIEGKLEKVRLSGEGRLRSSYVESRLSRGDEPLNMNVLQERFQLLLTDPMFAKINAQVLPGSRPGYAILDVEATRARPYQLSIFANNYHAPSTGSTAYGSTGWIRNLTGYGDLVDITYQAGKGNSKKGIGWSIPLSSDGTVAEMRYDEGDSVLIEEVFRPLDIKSTFRSKEFTISHPVINRLRKQLKLGITWSQRESASTLLGEPFSFSEGEPDGRTKTEVWRFSQDYLQRNEESVFLARSILSAGRNNFLQDPDSTNIPKRNFIVWLGQLHYAHKVWNDDATLVFRGLVQQTSDRLASLERISIGGVSTVRGYRESSILRDTGYAATVELHYPLFGKPNSNQLLQTLLFYDYGAAKNKGEARDQLSSAGIGLTGQYKGFSAELYVAARLKSISGVTGSDLQDKGIHFQMRYDLF